MSNPLLILLTLTNAGIAFSYWRQRNFGMCLVFASYAVACLGFIWSNVEAR